MPHGNLAPTQTFHLAGEAQPSVSWDKAARTREATPAEFNELCPSSLMTSGRNIEGTTGVIELQAAERHDDDEEDFSCDDPEAVALMIDFIYLGDYRVRPPAPAKPDMSFPSVAEPPSVTTSSLSDMLSAAAENPAPKRRRNTFRSKRAKDLSDKGSKRQCREEFAPQPYPAPELEAEPEAGLTMEVTKAKGCLAMHAELYGLASKYDLADLKDLTTKKMRRAARDALDKDDFAEAIATAFGSTPENDRGMRDVIIQTMLSCTADLVNDPAVEKAINAVEGLSFELFKRQKQQSTRSTWEG
ncbi:hypothetical protein PRZ48_014057 [Zasmidium cellare]|uniref:BTB domain-containing protein n=1 Tax=Zasmidium cellare TaxID=395010 RepID=A0ABR0DZU6_ZASCE|nr:hypothetical protein PRZ48_014057 [Zasmidium cellare]